MKHKHGNVNAVKIIGSIHRDMKRQIINMNHARQNCGIVELSAYRKRKALLYSFHYNHGYIHIIFHYINAPRYLKESLIENNNQ